MDTSIRWYDDIGTRYLILGQTLEQGLQRQRREAWQSSGQSMRNTFRVCCRMVARVRSPAPTFSKNFSNRLLSDDMEKTIGWSLKY